MKKILFLSIATSLLISPVAFAQTCDFEDLPSDHWAYKAVKQLCEKAILSGFPDKTFKGTKNVTRYELAASLTKITDALERFDPKGETQELKDMAETLKRDLKTQMDEMENDLDEMREDMKKEGESIKDTILKSLSKTKIKGRISSRIYIEHISGLKDVNELAIRPSLVGKLRVNAPVYEKFVTANLELSTGKIDSPTSGSESLGEDLWAKKKFNLTRANITWIPVKEVEIGIGKLGNPFEQADALSDSDVGWEGFYIKPQFDRFTFTTGVFPIKLDEKQGWAALDKSQYLAAGQVGFNFDFLNINLGLFSWQNADKTLSKGINNDGMTLDGDKSYYGFNVIHLGTSFNFDVGLPISLNLNGVKNLGKDFNNFEFDMPSAGKNESGSYKAGNTLGLIGGLEIGDIKKNGFNIGVEHGMIGSDATVGYFNASPPKVGTNNADVTFKNIGTNINYIKPYGSIGLADNVALSAFGYIVNKLADTNNTGSPSIISTAVTLAGEF